MITKTDEAVLQQKPRKRYTVKMSNTEIKTLLSEYATVDRTDSNLNLPKL